VTQGVAFYNGNRLKVPGDRIKVGERGRDAAALRAAGGDRIATRARLGVDPEVRLVISVGRQDYQKAHSALVAAYDQYADAHPADRLIIVGRRGTGSVELEAAISAMRNPDVVTVLGHRDDVPALVAAADVAVCSSLKEGAAGSLIEAMALGTPIVSVPLIGLKDVLIDGKNARVAPLLDLATILEELFNDPMQVQRLTAAARSDAEGRFSIDGSAKRLGEIFEWAVQ
jgi:glycosyltransferase involved in cell wall biosynthesis